MNPIASLRLYIVACTLTLGLAPLAARQRQQVVPDSLLTFTVDVGGVPVTMQRVEGGSFVMGATPDQHDPHIYTDKPAHLVFLSPYYIATTEVTNRLWRKVMPDSKIITPSGYPEHPVSFVSWHDAQVFVHRLDSLTGLPFRLPTEAEWEYAARGGEHSRYYRFAGGNEADSVGWLYAVAGQWTHPVARKRPNELGLYDMTGNVAEWCQDRYGWYELSTAPDPVGADTGSYRIVRGGSYDECEANSHLSVRRWYTPETTTGYIGLRVAFTLPEDPMMRPVPTEPALRQTVRIKGRRLHFSLVPGEQPYYISEPVSASLLRKITSNDAPERDHGIAIGMSRDERLAFAEQCSRLVNCPLSIASAQELEQALQQGIIMPPKQPKSSRKKRERSVRSIQRSRRVRNQASAVTELIGFRLSVPDDPVLQQYTTSPDDRQPLRLVMRVAHPY